MSNARWVLDTMMGMPDCLIFIEKYRNDPDEIVMHKNPETGEYEIMDTNRDLALDLIRWAQREEAVNG